MTNVEKMYKKLDEMGFTLGGLTPGPSAKGNSEAVAAEILATLERIEKGDYTVIANPGE